ncbi:MAG TPA: acylphosphatase [Terriglobales bacterium]
MNSKLARTYIISGRVQGVGFRWFVEHEARRIGVIGTVRNLEDGRVEAIAGGTEEQLAALKAKLQQGPRAARVDEVEERQADRDLSQYKDFSIEGAW